MSNNFQLATKEERLLFDFLKDGTKQHNEIVKELEKHKISESTINRLLKENEGKLVFRVTREDGKIFYRLNIFPRKILMFFALADQSNFSELLQVKDEVLRSYPRASFDGILKRTRAYLELSKPKLKGIIKILKDFEGKAYDNS